MHLVCFIIKEVVYFAMCNKPVILAIQQLLILNKYWECFACMCIPPDGQGTGWHEYKVCISSEVLYSNW
jgi:hypothetical protein